MDNTRRAGTSGFLWERAEAIHPALLKPGTMHIDPAYIQPPYQWLASPPLSSSLHKPLCAKHSRCVGFVADISQKIWNQARLHPTINLYF